MNRVEANAEEVPLPPWSAASLRFVRKVLKALDRDRWELSILYCNDRFIRGLNARYRRRDEATDILSFPQENHGEQRGYYAAGDIVISVDTLVKNAEYFGVPADEELRRLLIHGILHLTGMDHRTNEESEPMLLLQEKILNNLAEERIIP
jgi:probable rRNA maturation factor